MHCIKKIVSPSTFENKSNVWAIYKYRKYNIFRYFLVNNTTSRLITK